MRILFFTAGPDAPGSRFRCLQFFRHFARHGIECDVRFAYDERYNDVFDRPWASIYKLGSRLGRVVHLLGDRGWDLLYLHKLALPFSPFPEWSRSHGSTPMVFDFDDAIYLGTNRFESYLRDRTFRGVLDAADIVIAGNPHLATVAGRPEKTTVIPSVVDTDVYTPRRAEPGNEIVVGWMGTASNFPSLRPVIPQLLAAVEALPRARLRIVSNGVLNEYLRHPSVEQWRWNPQREVAALQSFDIGIMPLLDNEPTRGKCGFKMIQYMACGVAFVSSAVGANVDIARDSSGGVLVPPGGDWTAPIVELGRNAALRATMGAAGRRHAVGNYAVEAVLPTYLDAFDRAVARRGGGSAAAR